MEGRKLQKVGYSTLSISLPTKWIKQAGLKRGDTVAFSYEKDGSLKLMPFGMASSKGERHATINRDLCGECKLLERLIIGCYITGYNTITIYSHNRIHGEWLSAIRSATLRLAGLNIMDEKPNIITLQCSIDPSRILLRTIMRRLFALTVTMFTEFLEGLSNLNSTLAEEVIKRENEAHKLYWLILRIIEIAQTDPDIAEKVGVDDPRHLSEYKVIIGLLEDVADHLENVAKHFLTLTKLNIKPSKKIIEDLHQIGEISLGIFSGAFESIITDDLKKASKLIEDSNRFEGEEEKIVSRIIKETRDPEMAAHIRSMTIAFWGISDHGASIAQMAINMYVGKPSKVVTPISSERLSEEFMA